jgi:hypothetical protein
VLRTLLLDEQYVAPAVMHQAAISYSLIYMLQLLQLSATAT